MTQIKTSPQSVTALQPLSIQHETRVRLPLPKSISVALTVKPVSTTAKNRLETAQPLSALIQKELRSIAKRYRTVFVALPNGYDQQKGNRQNPSPRLTLNDADQRPRSQPKRRI